MVSWFHLIWLKNVAKHIVKCLGRVPDRPATASPCTSTQLACLGRRRISPTCPPRCRYYFNWVPSEAREISCEPISQDISQSTGCRAQSTEHSVPCTEHRAQPYTYHSEIDKDLPMQLTNLLPMQLNNLLPMQLNNLLPMQLHTLLPMQMWVWLPPVWGGEGGGCVQVRQRREFHYNLWLIFREVPY